MPYFKGHVPENPYRKGHVPWNKGKKLGVGASHNWLREGTKRLDGDGYMRVKVSCTNRWSTDWALEHKLIWEKAHGAIPKGLVFWFKDRCKTNIKLSNLELITKGERMKRNSLYNKTPEELKEIEQRRGNRKHINTQLKKQGYKINSMITHRIK